VIRELEEVFGAPVVEAYSMTEARINRPEFIAAGQAQTRNCRRRCRPESVYSTLPVNRHAWRDGEIAIRGPNVMSGYEKTRRRTRKLLPMAGSAPAIKA